LEQDINLRIKGIAKPNEDITNYPTLQNTGRRKLAFEESSGRKKRRKSKDLRKKLFAYLN